jgi:hypothetical protein
MPVELHLRLPCCHQQQQHHRRQQQRLPLQLRLALRRLLWLLQQRLRPAASDKLRR